MATARQWAQGYLEQARADLAGASAVSGSAPSTFAMLLQMVFEKFAKAALIRQGAVSVQWASTHHGAASRMVQLMRRQRGILDPLGGHLPWHDVLEVVVSLEFAHPQLAGEDGPQLEYPWQDVHGAICWPARDLRIAAELGDPRKGRGLRMLRFAELLSVHFDEIFV